jgi:hypothetical protein
MAYKNMKKNIAAVKAKRLVAGDTHAKALRKKTRKLVKEPVKVATSWFKRIIKKIFG